MNIQFKKELQKMLADNSSGSSELLGKLISFLLKIENDPKLAEEILTDIDERFNEFEVINRFIKKTKNLIKKNDGMALRLFLQKELTSLNEVYDKIYNKSKKYLRDCYRILTLSNSQTVFEIFKRLKNDNEYFIIIIAESRPALEGRLLAKKLLKENIKIEMITDAAIPGIITSVDAVVTGADVVLKNGNIINKTGTWAAAFACRNFNTPFYVVTSKSKMSDEQNYVPKPYPPEEIWKYSHPGLSIRNYYFEEVYKRYITRIFTD